MNVRSSAPDWNGPRLRVASGVWYRTVPFRTRLRERATLAGRNQLLNAGTETVCAPPMVEEELRKRNCELSV